MTNLKHTPVPVEHQIELANKMLEDLKRTYPTTRFYFIPPDASDIKIIIEWNNGVTKEDAKAITQKYGECFLWRTITINVWKAAFHYVKPLHIELADVTIEELCDWPDFRIGDKAESIHKFLRRICRLDEMDLTKGFNAEFLAN